MFDQFDTQVEATQVEELKAQNSQEFKELKFLDSAELALIGGGGAHGGNFI